MTYTLNPKISSTLAPSLSPSECETEDEETDDEDQNHTSTDPSVSSINYIVKNLEKNGSIVIPTLSLPPSDEHMIHETHLTADIQCGSACFRVTRVPLNFCVSRLPSSDRKEVINAAPMIGARVMSSIDLSTSHLITPNRKFVAKLVGAWVRSIPVVTPSFVLEMNKRKDPSNPLPHVKDHLAEGKTQIDSLQCTPDQPKHILSKFMVLSLIESEAVMLCKCAGATIKKLYSANGDKTFWQTDKFFEDLTSESKEKGLHLIWIDSTSDSMKKGKEYLTEKTTSDLNLSCVTQSGIIRAITNLSPLEDIEGHVLNDVQQNIVNITKGRSEDQPEDRNDDTEDEIDQKKYSIDSKQDDTAATTSKDELPDVASNSVDDQKEFDYITQVNSVEDKQTTKNATNLELSIKPNGSKAKETRSKTEQFYETQEHHHSQKVMQKQEKVKSKQKKQSSSVSSGWTQSSQKSKSSMTSSLQPEDSQSSAWMTSQRMSKSGDLSKRKQRRQEDSNSWISTNKKLKSRKNDESLDLIEEDDGNDNSDGNGAMQAQQSLPKTDDGWFVAPKGKARLQYKCDVNEILGDNEIGIVEPAQTEMCNLIVVQKQVIQPAESASNTLSKDFKRFRKNSIISGARMHSIKPVMLDVHLPKVCVTKISSVMIHTTLSEPLT